MKHVEVKGKTLAAAIVGILCFLIAPYLNAQPCSEWNLTADFRVLPNQENPTRDSCGNMSVWYFMESNSATYPAHFPSTYISLSEFLNDAFSVSGLEQWQGSVISNGAKDKLSAVGINNTGLVQHPIGAIVWNPGVVRVHPFSRKFVIIGWKSPIDGTVSVHGGVGDIDNSCGDGISWSIDRFNGLSNSTLASGAFSEGGLQSFQDGTGGGSLAAVTVKKGDFIYVLVDPKASDYFCDSTAMTVIIRPVAAGIVGIPVLSRAMLFALLVGLFGVATINLRLMARQMIQREENE